MDKEIEDIIKRMRLSKKEIELLKKVTDRQLKCNCLFSVMREGYVRGGCHSTEYEYIPPIYRCVKCGLTNEHAVKRCENAIASIRADEYIEYNFYAAYLYNKSSDDIFREKFGSIDPPKERINLVSTSIHPERICEYVR